MLMLNQQWSSPVEERDPRMRDIRLKTPKCMKRVTVEDQQVTHSIAESLLNLTGNVAGKAAAVARLWPRSTASTGQSNSIGVASSLAIAGKTF